MSDSRLPLYQRKVGIEPVQQPSAEGAVNNLINSFQSFTNLVVDTASKVGKEAADQQRDILKNNISSTYKSFALDALKNPDQNEALTNYQKVSRDYADGIIKQSTAFNKSYVTNLLDYYHNEHIVPIEKQAILQNKRVEQVNFYDKLNNAEIDLKNQIANAVPMVDSNGNVATYDAAKALYASNIQMAERAVQQGIITPQEYNSYVHSSRKAFTGDILLNEFSQHLKAGTHQEFLNDVLNPDKKLPGIDVLSMEERRQYAGQMINIRNEWVNSKGINRETIKKQIESDYTRVSNGGAPTLDQGALSLFPDLQVENYKSMQIAKAIYQGKQAIKNMTPTQTSAYIESIRPIDPNSPDYPSMLEKYNKVVAAIKQSYKDFAANPVIDTMNNETIKNMTTVYQASKNADAVGGNYKYSPFNTVVPKPYDAMRQYQVERGLLLTGKAENRVKLLDERIVPDMVRQFNALEPIDKIVYMNKLRDEYGEGVNLSLVTQQMVDHGMNKRFSLLRNIDPNTTYARDAAEAFSINPELMNKELSKLDSKKLKSVNNHIARAVYLKESGFGNNEFNLYMRSVSAGMGGNDNTYLNDMFNTVSQLTHYYMLQGKTENDSLKMAQNVISSRYDYTTIDNQAVRLPKNISAENVKQMATFKKSMLDTFDFNINSNDPAQIEITKEAIKRGHFINDNVDNGLVWVTINGTVPVDKNGQPYSFSFNEAQFNSPNIPTTLEKVMDFFFTPKFSMSESEMLLRPIREHERMLNGQTENVVNVQKNIDTSQFDHIKIWEGLPGSNGKPALTAYLDSGGTPTIGWGHTKNVKVGDSITEDQAEQFFKDDVKDAIDLVKKGINVKITDNQFQALVAFALNTGKMKGTRLANLINEHAPENEIKTEMMKWVHSNKKIVLGLVNRRMAESNLFSIA